MDFRDNIWQHAKKCTKVLNLACGLVSLSNRFNTSSIRRSDSFGKRASRSWSQTACFVCCPVCVHGG